MALKNEMVAQGNFLFRYRSYFPILLLPVAFLVIWATLPEKQHFYTRSIDTIEILAILICLFGLLIRIMTVGYTPKNTSGRNTEEGQVADSVNTSGIYSMVRHPLYLGNYFMWLGIAIFTGSIWFVVTFTLMYWLYYERIMMAEEEFLLNKFGKVYESWASSTPAFIPVLGKWNRPALSFSWKKVLKKEKNGLFAIFLVIFILQCWVQWLRTGNWTTNDIWSWYLMIGSGILYFILKFLKYRSSWLSEPNR